MCLSLLLSPSLWSSTDQKQTLKLITIDKVHFASDYRGVQKLRSGLEYPSMSIRLSLWPSKSSVFSAQQSKPLTIKDIRIQCTTVSTFDHHEQQYSVHNSLYLWPSWTSVLSANSLCLWPSWKSVPSAQLSLPLTIMDISTPCTTVSAFDHHGHQYPVSTVSAFDHHGNQYLVHNRLCLWPSWTSVLCAQQCQPLTIDICCSRHCSPLFFSGLKTTLFDRDLAGSAPE